MAERRMFAKTIVLSDEFLDMPTSARCLYFTLCMLADDDGFVNSPKSIMRQCGASNDDMKLLIAKQYVLAFETGVIVIRHWRIHNYIKKDRYKATEYESIKEGLTIGKNGAYEIAEKPLDTEWIQNGTETDTEWIQDGSKMDTQVRLGKDRLGKVSLGQDSKCIVGQKTPDRTENPETHEKMAEIIDYLNSRTGRRFKASNKSTSRLISARLKDGYSVEDFKEVIDKKCVEWMEDPQMQSYLRPETLFTPAHFESYLNQSVSQKKGKGLVF